MTNERIKDILIQAVSCYEDCLDSWDLDYPHAVLLEYLNITEKEYKEIVNNFTPSIQNDDFKVKDQEFYESLLISMAVRAGEMEMDESIDLDLTVRGEDDLAEFIKDRVKQYLKFEQCLGDDDMCFDIFIEQELEKKYGKEI